MKNQFKTREVRNPDAVLRAALAEDKIDLINVIDTPNSRWWLHFHNDRNPHRDGAAALIAAKLAEKLVMPAPIVSAFDVATPKGLESIAKGQKVQIPFEDENEL